MTSKIIIGDMRYRKLYSLNKLLESTSNTQIIITSKNGGYVKDNEAKILARLKSFRNLLIVFGTPKKGVDEMLERKGAVLKHTNLY